MCISCGNLLQARVLKSGIFFRDIWKCTKGEYICLSSKLFISRLNTQQMNKAELIDKIAKDAGVTKTQANDALDSFTNAVVAALKKGDRVTLVGFGTFSVSERSARNGRNPQTGEVIKIKARKVPKFKAGKEFSTKIASGKK
ncbi:MAG TPA: HU family DNA-binding protein [Flavipsychrobacter sp.]|nr:HU family DNA-binding protein [Chitinophagales bacterium]HLO71012.1 HU family DNA-binding protein [Flavipsychrobacter sp.]